MRHRNKFRRLGVRKGQRTALLKSLQTALALHGQIQTTLARAKELRMSFDKLITLGKRGDLHARRLVYSRLAAETAVYNIFEVFAPVYKDRQGGYTRIIKLKNRTGDNAEIALIQLVDLVKMKLKNSDAKETAKKEGDKAGKKAKDDSAQKAAAKEDKKKGAAAVKEELEKEKKAKPVEA